MEQFYIEQIVFKVNEPNTSLTTKEILHENYQHIYENYNEYVRRFYVILLVEEMLGKWTGVCKSCWGYLVCEAGFTFWLNQDSICMRINIHPNTSISDAHVHVRTH